MTFTHMQGFMLNCVYLACQWDQNFKEHSNKQHMKTRKTKQVSFKFPLSSQPEVVEGQNTKPLICIYLLGLGTQI
jgi:hypothetical protein